MHECFVSWHTGCKDVHCHHPVESIHPSPAVNCIYSVHASRLVHVPVYRRVLRDDFNDVYYLMDMVKQVQSTTAVHVCIMTGHCVCVLPEPVAFGLVHCDTDCDWISLDPCSVVLLSKFCVVSCVKGLETVSLLCVSVTYHLSIFLSSCCGLHPSRMQQSCSPSVLVALSCLFWTDLLQSGCLCPNGRCSRAPCRTHLDPM